MEKKEEKRFRYFENGQRMGEFNYIDGIMDGRQIGYYSNGQVCFEANYKNEKLNGYQTAYHENKQKYYEYVYQNGKVTKIIDIYDIYGRKQILSEGVITVYKLCRAGNNVVYVTLEVPSDVKRITPMDCDKTFKMRVAAAKVMKI